MPASPSTPTSPSATSPPTTSRSRLVHGRVDAEDDLVDSAVAPLRLVESYDGGRHRFDGDIGLGRPGPFGYTVRVVPKHGLLVATAEPGGRRAGVTLWSTA
ncbi:hypothetical protein [Nocardioides convexus]|uniref:hypothetical protein n=1 Tax=Nocardioides convexus TaxID=2712224 RepID=UPI002418A4B3|nr:hypothetical protein [Nocardioides convexus]